MREPVAQLVEHRPFKAWVLGSSPSRLTTYRERGFQYNPRMDWRKYITVEPDKRSGKPCIRGMRVTVSDVLDYLASGMTPEEVVADSRNRSIKPPFPRCSTLKINVASGGSSSGALIWKTIACD